MSGRAAVDTDGSRDAEYDLLTAALLGIVVGAGITLLVRRGPSGIRPVVPALVGAGRGLAWAGRQAADASSKGAHWAAEQGEDLWDRVPRDRIRKGVRKQLRSVQSSIDDVVETELRDLRRAIRRRRKQLGL